MHRLCFGLFCAILMFSLAGCYGNEPPELTHPTHPAPAAASPSSARKGQATVSASDGATLWHTKECDACHGPRALGGMGGPLAGTALAFDQFLGKTRNGLPPMPSLSETDLSNSEAHSIYLWLRTLSPASAQRAPVPAPLPGNQILGIQVWTQRSCNQCHGAFAQGGNKGPALKGQAYPFERQRAVMRASSDQIPAHGAKNISDGLLRRLLDWLRRGADPLSGC